MAASREILINSLCEKVRRVMAERGTDEIVWDDDTEILLFLAMIGHKPVGINRNFMMAAIHNKFSTFINKEMTSEPIWKHLDTMYDMAALHESEIIPFPNDEVEYSLPPELDEIAMERLGISVSDLSVVGLASPTKQISKQPKKPTPGKLKQNATSSSKASSNDAHFRKPLPQPSPVSAKSSKGSSSDVKGAEKGSGKPDKLKVSKQAESSNSESKTEPKKAIKTEKVSHEEKDKKPRESSGAKVTKSSTESSSSKPSAAKDESKVSAKVELAKKEQTELKTSSSSHNKPAKKETGSSANSEKSSKEAKQDITPKPKRIKSGDAKKPEQTTKRRRN